MRSLGISRRWLVAGAIGLGVIALVLIGLGVIYPYVGAYMIRHRITDKVATRLGRDVHFGRVDVSLGHAVIRDLEIRGPLDGDTPLFHVDRIDVDFDGWASLYGKVKLGAAKVDGVIVTLRRDASGRDNVRDALDKWRATESGQVGNVGGVGGALPTMITVSHARLLANDDLTGTTALVADGDARWTRDGLVAHARGVTATTTAAPKAVVAAITIEKPAGAQPLVSVDGGELQLWPKMALSGIGGKLVADPDKPGDYVIDLAGGYGGVPGRLWTAKGEFDPRQVAASIDLEAAKFQLDRLAPILEHSGVVDYQATSIDTTLHLDLDRGGAKFSGGFHLRGLNVGHPMIGDKEVHDLDLSGQIAGTFDRATRRLELARGDFNARNVSFSLTGSAAQWLGPIPEVVSNPAEPNEYPPKRGPLGLKELSLRILIPPIDCQHFLTAIPTDLAPYLAGYRLKGVFDADIHLAVDWGDLKSLKLGKEKSDHIAINKCKVVDEPADSPKRLKDEFEHYVEQEKGEWVSFVVGPSNPDFVPMESISPYVVKSIESTEDSGFYQHHGFIVSEFETALRNDLKTDKFSQGASSITMQMVKNVLLTPEKTLSRKLQELFLTWHVENTLDKDRILEIYLNVIEFGPGLYGIGPAAKHYFGKSAKDINPVEAAFFSSILPSPKERYKQYCEGTLTHWTTGKIERILGVMKSRDRLTPLEYDQAMATPLLFVKDGSESVDDCLKRVKKAIKNARPTNPLAPKDDKDKKDPGPGRKHHHSKKSS